MRRPGTQCLQLVPRDECVWGAGPAPRRGRAAGVGIGLAHAWEPASEPATRGPVDLQVKGLAAPGLGRGDDAARRKEALFEKFSS